ncbi:MAG: hypothetical protein EZS28_035068 [Streblomastix strix]|uniref:Uncharacterized protein n=1 Tax=Streblomastix strix TaxID=222440 RepID=A0A5J4UIL0_9EUKA|nr:MAG: hypothetical protein EZS28_035068 [Streblomastix strix]
MHLQYLNYTILPQARVYYHKLRSAKSLLQVLNPLRIIFTTESTILLCYVNCEPVKNTKFLILLRTPGLPYLGMIFHHHLLRAIVRGVALSMAERQKIQKLNEENHQSPAQIAIAVYGPYETVRKLCLREDMLIEPKIRGRKTKLNLCAQFNNYDQS